MLPFRGKIDNTDNIAGYCLGCGSLVIDKHVATTARPQVLTQIQSDAPPSRLNVVTSASEKNQDEGNKQAKAAMKTCSFTKVVHKPQCLPPTVYYTGKASTRQGESKESCIKTTDCI